MGLDEDRNRLRRQVVGWAQAAGRQILRRYRDHRYQVETKGDGSPVTIADREADTFLRAALLDNTGVPVISEETAVPDYEVRRHWPAYWLVDPLDGTRDFVGRTGDFAVCIALIEGERPTLGVISAPALGLTWSGALGVGAFRQAGPAERRIHARDHGPRIALASRFHRGQEVPEPRWGIEHTLIMGSAIKFGRVAEGSADLYLRRTPTSEWDVAAGDAIVCAAGCQMRTPDGAAPLRYNQAVLKVPGFLVSSPRLDAPPPMGHGRGAP